MEEQILIFHLGKRMCGDIKHIVQYSPYVPKSTNGMIMED